MMGEYGHPPFNNIKLHEKHYHLESFDLEKE